MRRKLARRGVRKKRGRGDGCGGRGAMRRGREEEDGVEGGCRSAEADFSDVNAEFHVSVDLEGGQIDDGETICP